jgi:CheY-like chemotaxis protein
MPLSRGELVAHLKQRPQTARIPVIVLTGWKSAKPGELPEGAEFVIYKDIDIIEQLDHALGVLIGCDAAD